MTATNFEWADAPTALTPDTSPDAVSGVKADEWDDATDIGTTRTGSIATDESWVYEAPVVADHHQRSHPQKAVWQLRTANRKSVAS